MYKLEVFKNGQKIRSLFFMLGDELGMRDYIKEYKQKGFCCKVWPQLLQGGFQNERKAV